MKREFKVVKQHSYLKADVLVLTDSRARKPVPCGVIGPGENVVEVRRNFFLHYMDYLI